MDMLLRRGVAMTRKHFAMGLRIEHPQDAVDLIQYAQLSSACGVMPADYKQAHVASNGRGIYTFCMCPGGEVIACSSEPSGVVTNGMSRYKRSSGYANAGIVVQTRDEDFDALGGEPLLRGRDLQRRVEEAAFRAAGGTYAAPALRVTDFLKSRTSRISPRDIPATTYGPAAVPCLFDGILPEPYLDALAEGLRAFDRRMPGFVSDEAVLLAPESRTSSPVRIERNGWCESPTVPGLFPAGEGAGFAGGIVSAALDGLRVAAHARAKLAGEPLARGEVHDVHGAGVLSVRRVLVGTAGHIDHGKSALVNALTGTDPDRLPEEKARGITIDLGFAHAAWDDTTFSFVDVPGHEKFVRTMVAGAQGVDLVLFAVASDDSVMPQTREHLDILKLLGLTSGVIARTKSDLVDAETGALVEEEIRALVKGSFLANAPIVPVSAVTGEGLRRSAPPAHRGRGARRARGPEPPHGPRSSSTAPSR